MIFETLEMLKFVLAMKIIDFYLWCTSKKGVALHK